MSRFGHVWMAQSALVGALALCALDASAGPPSPSGSPAPAKPAASSTAKPAASSTAKPAAASSAAPAAPATSSAAPAASATSSADAASSDAMKSTASELFEKGVQAMGAGKWEECRAALLAAWSIHRSYQIAGNLAECEVKLGRVTDAAAHVTAFLKEMPASAPAERRARGEELLREVRPKVAELIVRVNKPDAEVLLDDTSIGRSPLMDAVFVEPGDHRVEARLGGAAIRSTVAAKGGEAHDVTLHFLNDIKPPPPPPQKSLIPLVALGASAIVAGAVGGGVLGAWSGKRAEVKAISEDIRAQSHSCVEGAANFDDRCPGLESGTFAAEALNRAGIGLVVGASILAVGAGAYWLFWPAPAAKQSARWMPVASPQGGGFVVTGSF